MEGAWAEQKAGASVAPLAREWAATSAVASVAPSVAVLAGSLEEVLAGPLETEWDWVRGLRWD